MTKQVLVSIAVVVIGLVVLSIVAYATIQFFSPPIASVPGQDPSAGMLPRPVPTETIMTSSTSPFSL